MKKRTAKKIAKVASNYVVKKHQDKSHNLNEIDYNKALIGSIFLGWLGLDRMYIGQVGLGLLKLFTFGGMLIWWIIDIFYFKNLKEQKTKEYADKIETLVEKYGQETVNRVFNKRPVIGDNLEVILLMLGSPSKKDEEKSTNYTKYTLKYYPINNNSYRLIIYIKDGVVVKINDKR